ncbi:MAG: HD domain-containing protein [Candidatus Omnitrophica bacterium]|nr:HD domain-containing protein [Candidatus Omnitrophota bacterium]
MRKTNNLFNLLTYFLIQAFILVNTSLVYGDTSNNKTLKNCLAPALQIGREDLSQIYFILRQRENIEDSDLNQHKDNGFYLRLINKIVNQVGTADELLKSIKKEDVAEFSEPIDLLEKLEKKHAINNGGWILEHEKEVLLMSYCMGKILGFNNHRLTQLAIAARFHDIGKCKVDKQANNADSFFSNPSVFTRKDRTLDNEIAEHTARSKDILKAAGIKDKHILDIVFYHHANLDGSGYPDPITRQTIPLEAKIIRVTNSFSAMLGKRPDPRALRQSFQEAVREIESNVYSFYGPRVVKTFMSMLEDNKIINRRNEFYYIPLREAIIFRDLLKEANKIDVVYPLAKVACGISNSWNEKPYSIATNSIGRYRHAEVNLVLKVLDEHLRKKGLHSKYQYQLRRLEFLAYTSELNKSAEAVELLSRITLESGNPFKDTVIYSTLQPCSSCLELLDLIGIHEIYYASEHQNPEFVASSEKTIRGLRGKGTKVFRSYFQNEGILEPNRLFYAFCNQPGYEKITKTINTWFEEFINDNHLEKLPVRSMKNLETEFANIVNGFFVTIDADLEQVNETLLVAKELTNQDIMICSRHSILKNQYPLMQAI